MKKLLWLILLLLSAGIAAAYVFKDKLPWIELPIANNTPSEQNCSGIWGHDVFLKERQAYDNQHRAIAEKTYLYAQMATNSYGTQVFDLPSNIRLIHEFNNKNSGFDGHVYEWTPTIGSKRLIVTFRGTQDWRDWLFGNTLDTQYTNARELIDDLQKKYPAHLIIVTGHSLGGGLALHISQHYSGIPAYVFNPSYKTHGPQNQVPNERIVLAEQGDILAWQRKLVNKQLIVEEVEDFYCVNANDHGIYGLARCLTHIAAIEHEPAETSLLINQDKRCEASP